MSRASPLLDLALPATLIAVAVALLVYGQTAAETTNDMIKEGTATIVGDVAPGSEFEVVFDRTYSGLPGWILTNPGSGLYLLSPSRDGGAPRFHKVGATLDQHALGVSFDRLRFILPPEASPGVSKLCNQDLCLILTIAR